MHKNFEGLTLCYTNTISKYFLSNDSPYSKSAFPSVKSNIKIKVLMEHWYKDTDKEDLNTEIKLSQCQFVHHISRDGT
jgi:hypothetical protein